MNLHLFHRPAKSREDEPAEPELALFRKPEHNTTEGSEFLDDSIRMSDQPLRVHTEESIAAGSPENFL